MNIRFAPNTLYYGDCLDILRDFPSGCVDLICLDPPFNSNANYHTIFRGSGLSIKPQIKAFDDMWLWDSKSAERVRDIKNAIVDITLHVRPPSKSTKLTEIAEDILKQMSEKVDTDDEKREVYALLSSTH